MRLFSSLLKYVFYRIDDLAYKKWNNKPFSIKPISNKEKYYELWNEASLKKNPEVDQYEENTGFKIDKDWLNNLALRTQIVIKKSELNYAHNHQYL